LRPVNSNKTLTAGSATKPGASANSSITTRSSLSCETRSSVPLTRPSSARPKALTALPSSLSRFWYKAGVGGRYAKTKLKGLAFLATGSRSKAAVVSFGNTQPKLRAGSSICNSSRILAMNKPSIGTQHTSWEGFLTRANGVS
jgi:hypothetical protein